MKALVVGYGSIGAKHAKWLMGLGCQVSIVSKREIKEYTSYSTIESALEHKKYDYVIIANATHEHYSALMKLAALHHKGRLLVEKPLFDRPYPLPQKVSFEAVSVAYNLRFHPILQLLRNLLQGQNILSAQIYVGQYLPDWRPMADYRSSYSAKKREGGGVLRDLSHELDYVNWLLGKWNSLVAVGGHFSHLEIDSEDVQNITLQTQLCPIVNIQLNYLDRKKRREMIINTDDLTIKADLVQNQMEWNSKILTFDVHSSESYILQHQAVLRGDYRDLCTLEDGLEVLSMIHAAEESCKRRRWIYR